MACWEKAIVMIRVATIAGADPNSRLQGAEFVALRADVHYRRRQEVTSPCSHVQAMSVAAGRGIDQ